MGKLTGILFIFITMTIFIPNDFVISQDQNQSNSCLLQKRMSNIKPMQEPVESDSIPVLDSQKLIEFGENLTITYGMFDDPNYIAGYSYRLYLVEGHSLNIIQSILDASDMLIDGITLDTASNYLLQTLNSTEQGNTIIHPPGDYTVYFQINSTNRGLLNESLEIIINSPPSPLIETYYWINNKAYTDFSTSINKTSKVELELRNVGQSDAFEVSIGELDIDKPLGLGNFEPPILSSINPNQSENISFTIRPENWGIGQLLLKIDYLDANGVEITDTSLFQIRVLPNIHGKIEVDTSNGEIDIDNNVNARAILSTQESSFTLQLEVKIILISATINFLPVDGQPFQHDMLIYGFKGDPIQLGYTDIELSIEFTDRDGGQTHSRQADQRSIHIVEKISTPEQNPLLSSILVLYTVIMILVIIFYFRRDVRNKFFSRILGVQFVNPIKFPSTSVIIDGSNVAWEEYSINRKAKLSNITLAIKTVKEAGIKEIIIIADASLRYQIDRKDDLDKLVSQGIVKLTPAKVDADGLILRLAAETGSLILSNDLYKQHREEYNWIDSRRIPYTIINDKIYLHPIFEKKTSRK